MKLRICKDCKDLGMTQHGADGGYYACVRCDYGTVLNSRGLYFYHQVSEQPKAKYNQLDAVATRSFIAGVQVLKDIEIQDVETGDTLFTIKESLDDPERIRVLNDMVAAYNNSQSKMDKYQGGPK